MDQPIQEAIKVCLTPILQRFANGITDVNVKQTTDRHNTKRYEITTNTIPMSPCVFKSLYINGIGYLTEKDNILWRFKWKWETFGGGSNGADMMYLDTNATAEQDGIYVKNMGLP